MTQSEPLKCAKCGQNPIQMGFKIVGIQYGALMDEESSYCVLCFQEKAERASELANAAMQGYKLAKALEKMKTLPGSPEKQVDALIELLEGVKRKVGGSDDDKERLN